MAARCRAWKSLSSRRDTRQNDHPGVTIVDEPKEPIAELARSPGRTSGSSVAVCTSAASPNCGLVDTVEVGVIPVLLGEGVPLIPGPKCE